jgi:hypothetical protein
MYATVPKFHPRLLRLQPFGGQQSRVLYGYIDVTEYDQMRAQGVHKCTVTKKL